jgi:hypothetical protein
VHFLPYSSLAAKAIQQEDYLLLRQQESLMATQGYNHFYKLSLPQLRELAGHVSLQHEKGQYPEGVYRLLVSFLRQRIRHLESNPGKA